MTEESGRMPEVSLPFAVNFCGAMTGWGEHDLFTRDEAILRGGYPKIGSGTPGWNACLAFGLIEPAPRRAGHPQAHRMTEDGLLLVAYGPRGDAPATDEEAGAARRAWGRVPGFEEIRRRMDRDAVPPSGEIRAALRSLYPGLRDHTAYRVSVAYHDSLNYLLGKPNTYKIVPAPLAGLPQYGERPARARAASLPGAPRGAGSRAAAEWRGQFPLTDLEAALGLAHKVYAAYGKREFRLAKVLGGPWAGADSADQFYACSEYGLLEMRVGSTSEMPVYMRVSDRGLMFCEGGHTRETLDYALRLSATRPRSFKVLLAHIPEPPYSVEEVKAVLANFLTVDVERRAELAAEAFWRTMRGVVKATGKTWEELAALAAISQSSEGDPAVKKATPEPDVGEPWKNLGFVLSIDEGTPAVELRAPGSKAAPIRLTMRHQVEAMIRELQASLKKVEYHEGARPRVSAPQPRRLSAFPPRALRMPTRRMELANGGTK